MSLSSILKSISDYGDALASKIIHHFGLWVGVGGGAVTYSVGKTIEQTQMSPMTAFVLEWGGLISMLAAGTLILKNLTDTVLGIIKSRREGELHKKKLEESDDITDS